MEHDAEWGVGALVVLVAVGAVSSIIRKEVPKRKPQVSRLDRVKRAIRRGK
jgi:hypothetical protein